MDEESYSTAFPSSESSSNKAVSSCSLDNPFAALAIAPIPSGAFSSGKVVSPCSCGRNSAALATENTLCSWKSVVFRPKTGTDTAMNGCVSTVVSVRYQCITMMTGNEHISYEELRAEAYAARRSLIAISEDTSRHGPELLSKNLQDAFENPQFSDVTLKVGHVEYPAHKIILAKRSKVFEAMFQSKMKESRENVVNLVEMKPCIAKEMLKYMYTGRIQTFSMDTAMDLYVVADRYELPELKKWSKDFLLQHISAEFVCDLAALAVLHDDKDLEKASKHELKKNVKAVLSSKKWLALSKENPDFYFQMLQDALNE